MFQYPKLFKANQEYFSHVNLPTIPLKIFDRDKTIISAIHKTGATFIVVKINTIIIKLRENEMMLSIISLIR